MNTEIIDWAIKKASQSSCAFKISAIGFDKRGKVVGSSMNNPRFDRKGGGMHAEIKLINRYRNKLKTIIICRVNKTGGMLPIHPCEHCKKTAEKNGIKIYSIDEFCE